MLINKMLVLNQNYSIQQQSGIHAVDPGNVTYSAKHAGIYLHVCRILRPLWKKKCLQSKGQSSITYLDCAAILDDLYAVRSFIESLPINNVSG